MKADLETLKKDIQSHLLVGPFSGHGGAGGCVTLVSKALLSAADASCSFEVLAGRCVVVNIHLGANILQVANLHIELNAAALAAAQGRHG